jgi:hypothetical protein
MGPDRGAAATTTTTTLVQSRAVSSLEGHLLDVQSAPSLLRVAGRRVDDASRRDAAPAREHTADRGVDDRPEAGPGGTDTGRGGLS